MKSSTSSRLLPLMAIVVIFILAGSKPVTRSLPVLCYHHIKSDTSGHSPNYTIGLELFQKHIKMLSDSGYRTVLPGQRFQTGNESDSYPAKQVMLTFDDGYVEHFTIAAAVLEQYGFRGVFFVPTVCINKTKYLSDSQIRQLADSGHVIGVHTYDHPDLRKMPASDRDKQIDQPKRYLEKFTGGPVVYFAYPYGNWTEETISMLKDAGFAGAFQLNGHMSGSNPDFTMKRAIVKGTWTPEELIRRFLF